MCCGACGAAGFLDAACSSGTACGAAGVPGAPDFRPPRGLPARSPSAPRASLGASARSPARPRRPRGGLQSVGVSVCCPARPRRRPRAPQPGPAAAHGPRSQAPPPANVTCPRVLARRHSNFACNSRLAISNFEFISLELQRFQTLLKVHAIELHAILLSAGPVAHGPRGQDAHAGQSSPCSGYSRLERYKVLPADAKWPKIGVFGCVGRVLYRFDPRGLRTGRVLYRAVESGVQGRFRETTGTTADYQFAADRHRTS